MVFQPSALLVCIMLVLNGCAFLPVGSGEVKRAIYYGDTSRLSEIYRSNYDLSEPLDESGNHPLHIASMSENFFFYERLEREGASPFALNNEMESPVSIFYRESGRKYPGNWAAQKMNESRKTANGILSNIKSGYLSLVDFKKKLNPPSFELNVLEVGRPDETLALALLAAGELSYLEALLESGGTFGSPYGKTQKPIIAALRSGSSEPVKFAIDRGANSNATKKIDGQSFPVLSMAIFQGKSEIVRLLIENGADVNQPTSDRLYPLHFAIGLKGGLITPDNMNSEAPTQILNLLFAANPLIEARDNSGPTPLHVAAQTGSVEAAKALITRGASVDAINNAGNTPLFLAAREGYLPMLRELLTSGANVMISNSLGGTPLHAAASGGSIESVKILILSGADVKAQTQSGATSLVSAIMQKKIDVARYLSDYSPSTLKIADNDGWTPLHLLYNGNPDYLLEFTQRDTLAREFVKNGALLEATTNEHMTPLYLAVENTMPDGAKTLIDLGSNVNYADPSDGMTVLMESASSDDAISLAWLLRSGAKPNAQDTVGRTALHYLAARNQSVSDNRYADMTRLLVGWGASVDVTNDKLETPLMIAAQSGNEAIVKALMTSNANPYLTDYKGATAEFMAYQENHYKIIKLIRYLSSLYEG